MSDTKEIIPCASPIRATVRPPGSKSITNRALICASLAQGDSVLNGALASDDTRVMIEGLRRLGVGIEIRDGGATIRVQGAGGAYPATRADVQAGNSGTTIRFLTAAAALGSGRIRLDGVPRMRERPIGDLASALNQLGGDVRCELGNDCPPVIVNARGLEGGQATVRGDTSSQFLSGLLMAAPGARSVVTIAIAGTLVSEPYVEMTRRIMDAFGAATTTSSTSEAANEIRVDGGGYRGQEYSVEPDASAASYFFAAAAVTAGEVTVEGLGRDSVQGDVAFCDLLAMMGCDVEFGDGSITVRGGPLQGIDADLNAISDTAQTLAATALFANGPTKIRNIAHVRYKETDRIAATARELRKLGAEVFETADGLEINPGALRPATIDSYDDHRMAMSFAIAGLKIPGVRIRDPQCTAKTYPRYFDDLEAAIAQS